MSLTPQQADIIKLAQANAGRLTSKQVIDEFGDKYFHNGPKYLGLILARMVESGLLTRGKKGVFVIGKGKGAKESAESGQVSLFEN